MFGFGKRKKLAPAEVAAGLLGVVIPVPGAGDKELETLHPEGPADLSHLREELFILRIFAVLHAVRHAELRAAIQEAFWVFLAEGTNPALSQAVLDAMKGAVDEY